MYKVFHRIFAGLVLAAMAAGAVVPVSAQAADYAIYSDSLAEGWSNWSWDSTVSFGEEIAWTPTGSWSGLYLHKAIKRMA
jgi:hypothetical protein